MPNKHPIKITKTETDTEIIEGLSPNGYGGIKIVVNNAPELSRNKVVKQTQRPYFKIYIHWTVWVVIIALSFIAFMIGYILW